MKQTHSMEEADALANRVGIISKRLLDIGSTQHLREKYGHGFSVHVVLQSEPSSTEEEMKDFVSWVQDRLPGTQLEGFAYHGQLRLKVSLRNPEGSASEKISSPNEISDKMPSSTDDTLGRRSVASLFEIFEENKERLGIKFYSVSPSTFDEVFLNVIGKHRVQEEDFQDRPKRRWRFWKKR
jgi:ATP-binding cassette subfamily A (ABC1) protein 3